MADRSAPPCARSTTAPRAVARSTSHVADETDPKLGDISLHTALGVWHGVEAALQLTGIATAQILIQGLGHVGMRLARLAHRALVG